MGYRDVFSWLVLLVCGDVGVVDNDIICVDAGDNQPMVDIFLGDWLKIEEYKWWDIVFECLRYKCCDVRVVAYWYLCVFC